MFKTNISKNKTLTLKKEMSLVVMWKIFVYVLCCIVITILILSYNVFLKIDQDPFVDSETIGTKGIKQYNTDKVIKIKNYFDQKQALYNAAILNKPSIIDPSI